MLTATSTLLPRTAAAQTCAAAEPLTLNSTAWIERSLSGAPELFRLTFPDAGMFVLHASSAATDETAPRVTFLGDSCTHEGAGYSIIRETPIDLLLKITAPGVHYLTVTPEDPAATFSSFRLVTAFAADPTVPDEVVTFAADPPASCSAQDLPSFTSEPFATDRYIELRRNADRSKDVDPIECDISGGESSSSGVLVVESSDPLLATLYDDAACAPEDRTAEGRLGENGTFVAAPIFPGTYRLDLQKTLGSSYTVDVKYFALCGRGEDDDHGDSPLCATPLASGKAVAGILGDRPQDEDHFTFTVSASQPIRIGAESAVPLFLSLYDEAGQHLKAWKTCPPRVAASLKECRSQIVRTLGPGRFFLRVAGVGGQEENYNVAWSHQDAP